MVDIHSTVDLDWTAELDLIDIYGVLNVPS